MDQNLFIIIVFYNPTYEHISNAELIGQSYNTIVVDNSSSTIGGNYSFCYIPLKENYGIGKAQNIGIQKALDNGATHMIFFDQDSSIDVDLPSKLLRSYLILANSHENVSMLGPLFIDSRTKVPALHIDNNRYIETREIISSGLVISTTNLLKIGMIDSELFIDYVDFEWCWRARSLGFKIYVDTDIRMIHTIGYDFHKVLGLKIYLSAPIRYYYQYRNFIALLKRKYVPLEWKLKNIIRKTLDLFLVPIVSSQSKKTLTYMLHGLSDGLINKKGIYGKNI